MNLLARASRLVVPAAVPLLACLVIASPSVAAQAPADDPAAVQAQAPVDASALAARLADGEAARRRGDPEAALAPLSAAALPDWPLRGLSLLLLGEAQLELGRAEDALAASAAAEPLAGPHAPDVAWLRARSLDALSRAEAADAFAALATSEELGAQRRDRALVRSAELLAAAGRDAEAAAAFRRAAFEAPSQAPADALQRAEALATKAGKPLAALTTAQRLDLARTLRSANLHARAVVEYRRAEKGLAGPALASAKLARARSHFDLRENDEARATCAEVLKLVPGTESAADCRLLHARAAWRVDDGAAVLAQVQAGLQDARLRRAGARPDLRLVLGNFHLEQGRLEEAVKAFEALIAEAPKSGKAGEARWRIAWCRLLQDRPLDAAAEFARLAAEQPGGELERIGALWSAVSSERAGGDATEDLRSVARRWPWTYQGAQARGMLEARLPPEGLAAARAEWDASGHAFRHPGAPDLAGEAGLRYRLLRDAGLHAWALPEIESLQRSRGATEAFSFELARARARAGRASEAHALLVKRFGTAVERPSRRSPPEFWEVVYPMPLPELVQEASSRHGIDPALCAAIIRSESGWDPSARSWADARGLMQLLPATAAPLAKAEGLQGFHGEALFDPAVNVALGARHLSDLLALFEGDPDPAIASYNAGEDKVAAWWADFEARKIPPIERVERIPYRETRQYVRRVRDAMGWYEWLLACEDSP